MRLKNVLLHVTPASPGRFAGVARYARLNGWHLTVADRLTHALNGWTGDGALVTLRDDPATLRYVRALMRKGIPVVDLTLTRPEIVLPRVCGDNAAIGRVAAEHFRSRNFRHTAWFSTAWGPQHAARAAAFAQAMVFAPERWVWSEAATGRRADDWNALARWLTRKLAAAPRPLGVVCFDDADASRVEAVALTADLQIPSDVAVLGIGDDAPLCESQAIPISSVRHDLVANGYAGAELLAALMEGAPSPEQPVLIAPRGVAERRSTDALAAANPLVRQALAVYASDLARPPSTEMLADSLGVSRATLDRAFHAEFGHAPAHLLARLRFDEARRLLREGTLSLSQIANTLGYCDPAYFTNSFRKFAGVSPKAWRAAMVVPPGFEPGLRVSKTPVRPLHHGTN